MWMKSTGMLHPVGIALRVETNTINGDYEGRMSIKLLLRFSMFHLESTG